MFFCMQAYNGSRRYAISITIICKTQTFEHGYCKRIIIEYGIICKFYGHKQTHIYGYRNINILMYIIHACVEKFIYTMLIIVAVVPAHR
jgi:hypothetical protein